MTTHAKTHGDAADPCGTLASSFATSYAGVLAFMAVVNEGSFARAGDRLGIGRSAVSRNVQRLESQLDARLFHRTTRSTSLTSEGEMFFSRCEPAVTHIAQALEEMRDLRKGPPRGRLRICSAVTFGRKVVAPLLAGFRATYPDITLELLLDDASPDFTGDCIDVSFRNGRLEDSQVIARLLMPMQLVVCASPSYIETHGVPERLEELERHRGVHLRLPSGRVHDWEFKVDGHRQRAMPPGRSIFNDDELVLQAVLEGQGLAQLASYQVGSALRERRLVSCLDAYAPDDRGHYICYLSRQQLPARVRVFVDYMTEHIRTLHPRSTDLVPLAEA